MKYLSCLLVIVSMIVIVVAQDVKPSDIKDHEISITNASYKITAGEVTLTSVGNAGRLVDVKANYPSERAALTTLADSGKTAKAKEKNDAANASVQVESK